MTPGLGRYPGERHGNPLQYSWPGESPRQRSLADYSPQGPKGSDKTERTSRAPALGSLHYPASSPWLSILHRVRPELQRHFVIPTPSTAVTKLPFFILYLLRCSANRIVSAVFLDAALCGVLSRPLTPAFLPPQGL